MGIKDRLPAAELLQRRGDVFARFNHPCAVINHSGNVGQSVAVLLALKKILRANGPSAHLVSRFLLEKKKIKVEEYTLYSSLMLSLR